MAEWTATSVIKTKTERDVLINGIVSGNKAIDYGFTSSILRDGVEHHKYNEPNVGVPRGKTLDRHISDIIESHLVFWKFSETQPASTALPDVVINLKPDPEPEPQEKIDERAEIVAFRALMQTANAEQAAFEAGLEKTNAGVTAAFAAMDAFYGKSEFKDALKPLLVTVKF